MFEGKGAQRLEGSYVYDSGISSSELMLRLHALLILRTQSNSRINHMCLDNSLHEYPGLITNHFAQRVGSN